VQESLAYANASGARAVAIKGPMEGTSTLAELDDVRSPGEGGPKRRLTSLISRGRRGDGHKPASVTSVCSAHPTVVGAAMRQAAVDGTVVLIEATCNQVNHQGGYTGLTPAAFRDQVYGIADRAGLPRRQVVLGGDHLGPNPWRHLPAEAALAEAEAMVAAYVSAGYEKIHLDTSMGCQGEPVHLADEVTAERAARLAVVAQAAAGVTDTSLRYVIGTEVPVPGGSVEEIERLEVTRPEAVAATLEAHREAFAAAGAEAAFDAVIAVVAQPGVEFDDRNVVVYQPELAAELSRALTGMPGLVFEAHSTDYQPAGSLVRLVADGFAILKVGPGLTFALREALYALDEMATALTPDWSERSLVKVMEKEMLDHPGYWQPYYRGTPDQQRLLRHFSYSDRIRYYWAAPGPQEAVRDLLAHLSGTRIPAPLISQFLPTLYSRVTSGELDPTPQELVLAAVGDVLSVYADACRPGLPKKPAKSAGPTLEMP
jgi:D-tagatose-1,6-bisphosphate aldolase subunit GatZ/KbaZ